jgi:hypothetical protein
MPRVVDYPAVLRHMLDRGMRSLYHNSGAFGFNPAVVTHTVGWIGPDDPTIRPAARQFTRQVPPPYTGNLLRLAEAAWETIGGPAWLMPTSHWAYELEFGDPLIASGLRKLGIDPNSLATCNQASAIEFLPTDSEPFFAAMIGEVIRHTGNSDFALAFPDRPIVATIHHHRQIWWTSPDTPLIEILGDLVKPK